MATLRNCFARFTVTLPCAAAGNFKVFHETSAGHFRISSEPGRLQQCPRPIRLRETMQSSTNQLTQVLRRLLRAPLFTVVAMITLAAGVGANTVIFSVVEGVLLKPLPYPQPDRLIGVWLTAPGVNIKDLNLSAAYYFVFREQNRTLEDIGLYQTDSVSVTGAAEPEQVDALDITQATLPLLGTVPAVGRLLTEQDDSPGAPATAVLGYGYWRKKFGGDPSVIA